MTEKFYFQEPSSTKYGLQGVMKGLEPNLVCPKWNILIPTNVEEIIHRNFNLLHLFFG
jgi:hypothetical protein